MSSVHGMTNHRGMYASERCEKRLTTPKSS
jgi:hypothetical protein